MLENRVKLDSVYQHIILFDGVCSLCSHWVEYLLTNPSNVEFYFCAVQSNQGQRLLKRLGLPCDHFDSMVYMCAGQVYLKSDALLNVARQLPAPRSYLYALRYVPRLLRDACYDLLAKNRYRLSAKKMSCYRPSEKNLHRFL